MSFANVWYDRQDPKLGLAAPVSASLADNGYLAGLYDLSLDWTDEEGYGPVRDLRNALTHRYVPVTSLEAKPTNSGPNLVNFREQ